MKNGYIKPLVAAMLLGALATSAQAGRWEICKMELKVTRLVTGETQRIEGIVTSVSATPDMAECPLVGDELSFYPETADYQFPLRRKHWPAVGTTAKWRYIYLDGNCKNIGACRIVHYPVGW